MTCRSSLRSLRTSRQHAESTIHQIKCLVIIIVLNLADLVTDMLSEGQLHAGRRNGLLVQVKQNQPTLHETLARLCAEHHPFDSHETGGVARSIDWSRSSTPAGPRVAAADHLRRPGLAPDLREGHPVRSVAVA